jgi:hypothetical protein
MVSSTLTHGPLGLDADWTAYLSTAAPPLLVGLSQVSLTVPYPGIAAGDRGAVGTVRGMALTTLLAGPQPALLWAIVRK